MGNNTYFCKVNDKSKNNMAVFFFIAIIAVILFIVIVGSYGNEKQREQEDEFEKQIKESGAIISQHVKCYNGFISIDEDNKKIYLAITAITGKKFKGYSFSDILGCEVVLDDNSVYKKSTLRTVGGALVGSALLGGAGAIIGGLSGASQKKSNIKKAELKITVKDISNPNYKFEFYGAGVPSSFRSQKLEEVEKWKDIISIIIDRVDNTK